MRHARGSGLLTVLAVLFVAAFYGCEGDPGPAGPAGTAECFNCHTDDYSMAQFLKPIETAFEQSQHALATSYLRRDASEQPCSRCHTNEGYQAFVATGEPITVQNSSRIHCWTCHAPHTNMDFSQRKQGPTEFIVGGTYDKEESNTCAMCHQNRAPDPEPGDGVTVTSSRWGPHHGPQSNILSGVGAFPLPGATYVANHGHNNLDEGCVQCHMADPPLDATHDAVGGHSFWIAYEDEERINPTGCIECHGFGSPEDPDGEAAEAYVEAYQEEFAARLDSLRQDLIELGWTTSSDRINLVGGERTFEFAEDMHAVYNFLMMVEDHSMGVHNPTFENDLITDTRAYLATRME